jgi:pyrroloquinoline quinone biosynthesis protein B
VPLRVRVLGAGAGGGLPQWNCGCANCAAARAGRIPAMTQSSIAASADGAAWALINASPDLRAQLAAAPPLQPTGPRAVPLRSVLLTNADIDHVAGLLTLREKQPFTLHATAAVLAILAANPVFGALDPGLVPRRAVALEETVTLAPGLAARLFAAPGKVPLYLEADGALEREGEETVGVELMAGGVRAVYLPGCARMTPALAGRLAGAPLALVDGTLWEDDEMIRLGLGAKTGRRMGHMPIAGPGGALEEFAGLGVARKVFVHLNNSNPAVDPASPEAAAARAAGWEIAHDGMEIAL